jgi:hypothetical protein
MEEADSLKQLADAEVSRVNYTTAKIRVRIHVYTQFCWRVFLGHGSAFMWFTLLSSRVSVFTSYIAGLFSGEGRILSSFALSGRWDSVSDFFQPACNRLILAGYHKIFRRTSGMSCTLFPPCRQSS